MLTTLFCPLTGKVVFERSVKVVSAQFLQSKVIFLFVINEQFVGRSEVNNLFLIKRYVQVSRSTNDFCLNQLL